MTVAVVCGAVEAGVVPVQTLEVHTAHGLCRNPSQLTELVDGIDEPLVLGLHDGEFGLNEVQAALRGLGIDPLGVPIVALNAAWNSAQLTAMLAGAAARAAAYIGATPEQTKLRVPKGVTRRSLLTGGIPFYIGAPSISNDLCVAHDGCKVCAEQCPQRALTWKGGEISFARDLCVSCGICVTACPVSAISDPVATPRQIEAEIRAILEAAVEPVGLAFRCRDAGPFEPVPDWYPIEVPCTGMLSIGWILAPLLIGAGGVAALRCSDSGCGLGNDARLDQRLAGANAVLEELGLDASLVSHTPGRLVEKLAVDPPRGLFEIGEESQVVALLAHVASNPDLDLPIPGAAAGTVQINPDGCTTCGVCGTTCPPRALTYLENDDSVALTFDAARCVACGHCLTVCPEREHNAIALRQGYNLRAFRDGRQTVRSDTTVKCELCGGSIAPATTLARIRDILGPEAKATALIERRCLACRGR